MDENKPYYLKVLGDFRVTVPQKFREKHGIQIGDLLVGKEDGDSLVIRVFKEPKGNAK